MTLKFPIIALIFIFNCFWCCSSKINVEELKCLVCRNSVSEFEKIVSKIDPKKTVPVGGGRLDSDGNYQQKTVPQAKSELHLSELIESVCNAMDDYARATWKSNGSLTLLKLFEDGNMNPAMSEVDIIQDDDLNKSLKFHCESLVEEYEDEIIRTFIETDAGAGVGGFSQKICAEQTGLCGSEQGVHGEL